MAKSKKKKQIKAKFKLIQENIIGRVWRDSSGTQQIAIYKN